MIKQYPDELYHFGVKGMKWGVRKSRQQRAYERARRIVDRADRGKSPLMSLARKAGKALHKRGYVHPRTRKIIEKERRTLEGKMLSDAMQNDKSYKDALRRSRKAHQAYDNENRKYVEEGFPKRREKTLNQLADHVNKADRLYDKEYARIVKESRDESTKTVHTKYHYNKKSKGHKRNKDVGWQHMQMGPDSYKVYGTKETANKYMRRYEELHRGQ